MSWESSALYYRLMNVRTNERLGGHHNARSMLYSFDFDELLTWAEADAWDRVTDSLVAGAQVLEQAGASFLMITSVTGHASADAVADRTGIPLLHIADPVAERIHEEGFDRVGLIGTKFTMEKGFLQSRLRSRHRIETLTPRGRDRDEIHRVIIDDLTLGRVTAEDREIVLDATQRLADEGAQAIIVACTELPLLLDDGDYPVPALDATRLHADAAVDRLLAAA